MQSTPIAETQEMNNAVQKQKQTQLEQKNNSVEL
jgi:hypothetical protein